MKFSSLSLMASTFSSKLMGISTADNLLGAGSNSINSPNSFFETLWTLIKSTLSDLLTVAWETVVKIVYTVLKWMLTIIDFLFIFIREMIGMNDDLSNLDDISESDLIFKFIFSEEVKQVIRGMVGLAIMLLIIFCIFAIVKSEYDYVAHGKASNSKKGILVNALKSLLMMVLVPLIAIGGIVLTNSILKALYMATAGGTDVSMGTQVFVAAGYNANAYRNYANQGFKIPITYNFEEVKDTDNVTGWGGADSDINELDAALQDFKSSSVWNRGLTTFYMFYTDGFLDMGSVDRLNQLYRDAGKEDDNPYHAVYDKGLYSDQDEYYVMADAIDYSLKNRKAIYFKTAEDIYESYYKLYNSAPSYVRNNMRSYMPIVKGGGAYNFKITYKGDNYATEYRHIAEAKDEAKGAVFMVAIEESIEYDDKVYTYYYPLLSADKGFTTHNHKTSDQPVVAKGLFEKGLYPTAIKEEDGVVKFYRDDLNIPTLVDLFPTISYELPEGVTEDLGVKIIKGGFEAITGVSADEFIPYVYYSFDIFNLFTKTTNSIVKLDNGRMYVDYNFTQRNFTMENLYRVKEINLLILTFSGIILMGLLIKIMFGVALRVLDITLLFITYPAVLSTMPIDGGKRFSGWTTMFVNKLLSLYGIVVGINIVLLLFPIIDGLDLITPEMVASAFGGRLFAGATAMFLNYLAEVLFMLVGFTSIQRFGVLIEMLIDENSHDEEDVNYSVFNAIEILGKAKHQKKKDDPPGTGGIVQDGAMVVNDLAQLPKTVGNIVSGQILIDMKDKAVDAAMSMLPGGAVVKEVKDRKEHLEQKAQMKQDTQEMKDKIKNKDTTGFTP